MSCNPNRSLCSTDNVFAGVANSNCNQFFNPINFQAEQLVYDIAYKDLINNFGVPVNYYINTTNLSAADLLYGEDPTSIYTAPIELIMYIQLTEGAINLTKFGFASDDELTAYVHIDTFTLTMSSFFNYSAYGQSIEPKSGDVIELTALGCDRPNGRGSKWFEITERVDQDIATMNPLLGHYVYRLKAKRYEGSFEPGLSGEQVNNQVFENSFSGVLSSNIKLESSLSTEDGDSIITQDNQSIAALVPRLSSDGKSYPGDIDITSKEDVLDMSVNNTDIYGTYY